MTPQDGIHLTTGQLARGRSVEIHEALDESSPELQHQ